MSARTHAGADTTTVDRAADPTRDRILDSAYACFERYGVRKTTIEDIATEAGISRPTLYKRFANKDEIVNEICILETHRVNGEIRRDLGRMRGFENLVTESLLLSLRHATTNPYIRRFLESVSAASVSADPSGSVHQAMRDAWGGLIDRARDSGELATDLDTDEVVSWLTLSQSLLLIKTAEVDLTAAELREFIRRFLVRPLLA